MELAPLFKIGIPALLVITIGLLGRTRRIGFWGAFIFSIILTPVGGFLVALVSGPKPIGLDSSRDKGNSDPPVQKKKSWYSRAT